MQEEKKESIMDKKETKIVITMILAVIFFIILFILISYLGRIDVKIPTGHVDIFDINVNDQNNGNCSCCDGKDDCKCASGDCKGGHGCQCGNDDGNMPGKEQIDKKTVDEKESGDKQPEENKNDPENKSDEEEEQDDGPDVDVDDFLVYDSKKIYSESTPLNIFSHKSYYTVNNVIAPGTENAYQFIVRNNKEFAIKYDWKTTEENQFNINMKYRLKLNGEYILGDSQNWVTFDEIKQNDMILAEKSYNVYTLEWKWFESENDTQVGTTIDANYKLNIEFFAIQY